MKQIDYTWSIPILISTMVLLLGFVLILVVAEYGAEEESLFKPLLDFCWDQRQGLVANCADWAFAFIEDYGNAPADCLRDFDSDSALLAMCIVNIEQGR